MSESAAHTVYVDAAANLSCTSSSSGPGNARESQQQQQQQQQSEVALAEFTVLPLHTPSQAQLSATPSVMHSPSSMLRDNSKGQPSPFSSLRRGGGGPAIKSNRPISTTTENSQHLKEHIAHLLNRTDSFPLLVKIARTLETHAAQDEDNSQYGPCLPLSPPPRFQGGDDAVTTGQNTPVCSDTMATMVSESTVSGGEDSERQNSCDMRMSRNRRLRARRGQRTIRRLALSVVDGSAPLTYMEDGDVPACYPALTNTLTAASEDDLSRSGASSPAYLRGTFADLERRGFSPSDASGFADLEDANDGLFAWGEAGADMDPLDATTGTAMLPRAVRRGGRRVAVSAAPCAMTTDLKRFKRLSESTRRYVPKSAVEEAHLRRLVRACHLFVDSRAENTAAEVINEGSVRAEDTHHTTDAVEDKTAEATGSSPPSSPNATDTIEEIVHAMDKEVHAAGTAILEQGQEPKERMYLLAEGTCEAVKNGKSVGTLHVGSTFGELELMYKQARCAATIRCVTRCVVYTLDEESYHRAILNRSLQKRKRYESVTMTVPFLRSLPDYERMRVAEALSSATYHKGDYIIRFGCKGTHLHFILEGAVQVLGRKRGSTVEVVTLGVGNVVGELEFLFGHLTVADVVACSELVITACISRRHFELIVGPIKDRLTEFIGSSSTYESYYLSEVANASVRSEVSRSSQQARRRTASGAQQPLSATMNSQKASAAVSALSTDEMKANTTESTSPQENVNKTFLHEAASSAATVYVAEGAREVAMLTDVDPRGEMVLPIANPQAAAPAADGDGICAARILCRFPIYPLSKAGMALVGLREDGVIALWNEVLEGVTGYAARDVIGQSVYSFLVNEKEQAVMFNAISAARSYAGRTDAFFADATALSASVSLSVAGASVVTRAPHKGTGRGAASGINGSGDAGGAGSGGTKVGLAALAGIIKNRYTFSRSDGLTKAVLELTLVPPTLSAGEEAPEMLLGVGEEVLQRSQHVADQSQWLSAQLKDIIANDKVDYEQRIAAVTQALNNYEFMYRAMAVTTEHLRVVNIRQMLGQVIMDYGAECVERAVFVRQSFEKLRSEQVYLDSALLPECLRYAMGVALRLCAYPVKVPQSSQARVEASFGDGGSSLQPQDVNSGESNEYATTSIAIMVTLTETNGIEFLVINFNVVGTVGFPREFMELLDRPPHDLSDTDGESDDRSCSSGDDRSSNRDSGDEDESKTRRLKREEQSSAARHPRMGGAASRWRGVGPRKGRQRRPLTSHRQLVQLSRVRAAVEEQGGTIRVLSEGTWTASTFTDEDDIETESKGEVLMEGYDGGGSGSNMVILIPYIAASDKDTGDTVADDEEGGSAMMNDLSEVSRSVASTSDTSLSAVDSSPMAGTYGITLTDPLHCDHVVMEGFGAVGSVIAGAGDSVTGPQQLRNTYTFTTLIAEDTAAHRNMLCAFLWERRHAVLPAYSLADIDRLAGVADILIIDLAQSVASAIAAKEDPIALLKEKSRHMAIIITATSFEGAGAISALVYEAAGFITLKKPASAAQAARALRRAEDKIAVFKQEAERIAQTRATLAKSSRAEWERGALLGKGTFGEVYKAIDKLTGGTMAMKEIHMTGENIKMEPFVAEIAAMCSLQHPNIIHYFYCEESIAPDGVTMFRVFMEYAPGGTLQALLKKTGKLPFKELQAKLRDLTEGLAYIHSQNYVHCDIKTTNVLLGHDGKAKIGDFGTARSVTRGRLLHDMQGSPLYMSPECMSAGELLEEEEATESMLGATVYGEAGTERQRRKVGYSFPTDVWSLGCIVLEMVTNKPPFAHIKKQEGPAPFINYITSLTDVPDLSVLFNEPPSVVEFVSACLNPDPARRATASELLQFSIFREASDEHTKSAIEALQRAQLLHVLNKFVAFQDPVAVEVEVASDDATGRPAKPHMRDFFDSSSSSSDSSSSRSSSSVSSDRAGGSMGGSSHVQGRELVQGDDSHSMSNNDVGGVDGGRREGGGLRRRRIEGLGIACMDDSDFTLSSDVSRSSTSSRSSSKRRGSSSEHKGNSGAVAQMERKKSPSIHSADHSDYMHGGDVHHTPTREDQRRAVLAAEEHSSHDEGGNEDASPTPRKRSKTAAREDTTVPVVAAGAEVCLQSSPVPPTPRTRPGRRGAGRRGALGSSVTRKSTTISLNSLPSGSRTGTNHSATTRAEASVGASLWSKVRQRRQSLAAAATTAASREVGGAGGSVSALPEAFGSFAMAAPAALANLFNASAGNASFANASFSRAALTSQGSVLEGLLKEAASQFLQKLRPPRIPKTEGNASAAVGNETRNTLNTISPAATRRTLNSDSIVPFGSGPPYVAGGTEGAASRDSSPAPASPTEAADSFSHLARQHFSSTTSPSPGRHRSFVPGKARSQVCNLFRKSLFHVDDVSGVGRAEASQQYLGVDQSCGSADSVSTPHMFTSIPVFASPKAACTPRSSSAVPPPPAPALLSCPRVSLTATSAVARGDAHTEPPRALREECSDASPEGGADKKEKDSQYHHQLQHNEREKQPLRYIEESLRDLVTQLNKAMTSIQGGHPALTESPQRQVLLSLSQICQIPFSSLPPKERAVGSTPLEPPSSCQSACSGPVCAAHAVGNFLACANDGVEKNNAETEQDSLPMETRQRTQNIKAPSHFLFKEGSMAGGSDLGSAMGSWSQLQGTTSSTIIALLLQHILTRISALVRYVEMHKHDRM